MNLNPGPRMITEAKKSLCRGWRGLTGTHANASLGPLSSEGRHRVRELF